MALTARRLTTAKRTPYGYVPTEWVCITFITLFGLSTLIHAVQAIRCRLYWLLGTACVCGLLEVIGWSGRLWSHFNILLFSPYIMQITTTIIAPTPLIAANFLILGQIIRRLGSCYSRLDAKWYTLFFVSCDVVALVVQAAGGAIAATAIQNGTNPNNGGHIMLGGIVFQLAAITAYVVLASEFVLRCAYDKPLRPFDHSNGSDHTYRLDKMMKLTLLELAVSSLFIYIRSVYRTIELSDGWTGVIIHTQIYFNIFDGAMITLAMFTMNLLHPGLLLGPAPTWNVRLSPRTSELIIPPSETKNDSDRVDFEREL